MKRKRIVKPLLATRYADKSGNKIRDEKIKNFIRFNLHNLKYKDALKFYNTTVKKFTKEEVALLGANDRFFLLTVLMNRPDANHEWLYERCREVEAEPDDRLDLWARGHYKSTIITLAGSIQENIINPEVTISIFSETRRISENFLYQIKSELETNETLKELYSDVFYMNPERESPRWSVQKGIINRRKTNPKEATIEANGIITGMPVSRHYDILIFDDVITDEYGSKKAKVEIAIEKLQLAVNLGKKTFRHWYAGTRYSFGDPYGYLIGEGLVIPRLYPATHDGTENGKPVFLTVKQWIEWKKKQPDTFHAQMLQDPLTGKEQMFRPELFKGYEIRPHAMNVYIMVDPSSGKAKDNTAMVVVGVDSRRNFYFLDGMSHKMLIEERWNNMVMLRKKWMAVAGVEMVKVGYERYGMQADLDHFESKMQEGGAKNPRFELHELSWTKDGTESKHDRVQRLTAAFSEGGFLIPNVIRRYSAQGETTGWDDFEWEMVTDKKRVADIALHFKRRVGLSKQQQRMLNSGQEHRIAKPIYRLNDKGQTYDVTEQLIKEFLYFPLGANDDIPDAISRIYDIGWVPPLIGIRHQPYEEYYEDS